MPGDTEASDIAIGLLAYRTIRGGANTIDLPEEIDALVWEILALAAEEPGGQAFWWGRYYKVCLKGPRLGSVRCGQGHGQRKLQLFRYGR